MVASQRFLFPLGTIVDRDAAVWTTLSSELLPGSVIVGTCSCAPSDLALVQVTLERGARSCRLVPEDLAPFPCHRGFELCEALSALEGESTRITVQVRRAFVAPRFENGRLVHLVPVTFQLELLGRGREDS